MTDRPPSFDDLERGHVVLAPNPFKDAEDETLGRLQRDTHPFDSEQYGVTD